MDNVVITIGNLSDLTGPSSNAMEIINMALKDLINYYNENHIIPGIELKMIVYDGQMDPAKDIPGYEWLLDKGADLIFTAVPATPLTLKPVVDRDQVVLLAASGNREELMPPGYAFSLGNVPQCEAYILLEWIANNDWDYQANGPAKIGGATWQDGYSDAFFRAMEQYCSEHPDQFEWVSGYLTNFSFAWGPEVQALKECDYVFPPALMSSFVKEYRDAGYSARFIGTDVHCAFFNLLHDSNLWNEIDQMTLVRSTQWWNEEGEIIDLTKELLYENHPGDAENIMRRGNVYLGTVPCYQMLNIVAHAVNTVGAENVDDQALYDAAQSFSLTIDGVDRYSLGATKRTSVDHYAIFQVDAQAKDIIRADSQWYVENCPQK
ncbi:ABC transporter substrate-binding protein [Chloroflexota bacterium]